MKRIVDGKTYNTETATAVARWEYNDEHEYATEATIYQTTGGAFFAVHKWEDANRTAKVYFEAMDRDEVMKFVAKGNNLEILNDGILTEPPEATAEAAGPSETVYLRLPQALKQSIERKAKSAGQSVNVWAMRCLETCAGVAAE